MRLFSFKWQTLDIYITPEITGADSHSEPAPFAMESKPSATPVL